MADIAGTYYSNQSYNPKINYSVSYSQTGRSGSSVSYRVTVSYARQNGSYGYDVNVSYSIGGKSGNVTLKANNDWSASTSCTFNVTCSTNASGGSLYARIYSYSNTDGTHWQNGFDTGDRTVSKSTFNTAPYWGSGALISLSPNGTVREDTSSVKVSWSGASDTETTSGMKYKVDRYINGNFSATISNGTTSTSIIDNIGSGNNGKKYTYRVVPTDNYGVSGPTLTNSQTLTKNTLSAATISGNITIKNGSNSFNISIAGGSNSMGSGSIHRSINSPSIIIYNGNVGTGITTISIYRSGTVPTTPYIKYEDLRNLYKNASNQSGVFKINLITNNDYGSSGTNSININVDLRDNPNPPSSIKISGTVTANGAAYYIPNLESITVSWNNGSDKVNGSALTYEIQGSDNLSSGWKTLASSITSGSGTTSRTVSIPYDSYIGGGNYYFRVIGYNKFNLSASSTSGAITVHKYSQPNISLGVLKRTTTQIVIPITTTLNTSIPNTAFVSGKRNYSLKIKGTSTFIKASTSLTASPQTVTITGLEADKEYVLEVVANDNSGLSRDIIVTLNVSKYIPILSIRDKGIGINAYANSSYKFRVGGNAYISGETTIDGTTRVNNTLNANSLQVGGAATINGTLNATNLQVGGSNVYHTGRKPSASDVGALPIKGGTLTGSLYIGNGLSSSGVNNTSYSRIVRTSSDKGSSLKLQFGTGASSAFEIVDSGWSKALFRVVDDGEVAVNGHQIVSTGSANSGRYIKYYDGTMVCWGGKTFGTVAMTTKAAEGVYVNNSTKNFNLTFASNFTSAPHVVSNVTTSGYNYSCAWTSSTSTVSCSIWCPYSGSPTGISYSYIAYGRWY